jgi:hypothetical protein
LIFDTEIKAGNPESHTQGSMITTSCFGKFTDTFDSVHSILKFAVIGDLIQGTFMDQNITIGTFHYQLALRFSQLIKDPSNPEQINFIADGNMIPLDNENYIHQIAKGECHLNK